MSADNELKLLGTGVGLLVAGSAILLSITESLGRSIGVAFLLGGIAAIIGFFASLGRKR